MISTGLHLIAEGLSDFRDALVDCNETVVVKDLTKFISDLISCTESESHYHILTLSHSHTSTHTHTHTHTHTGNCVQFLIDIGVELTILYEHVYEIYGDIQGAANCFKIDAFEQGIIIQAPYNVLTCVRV